MNQRVLLGFSLSILLLIFLGIVSYQSIAEFQRSAQSVSQAHQIQNALEALMADLVSAESEARGYVIMGKEEYLQIYRKTMESTRAELARLQSYRAQTASPATIDAVIQLVEKRLERLRMTIDARQTEGLDGVVGLAGVGKKLMDEIRREAQQLEDAERRVLETAADRLDRVSRRTTWVIGLTCVLAVVFHMASTLALSRSITQRQHLEKALLETSEREQRRIGQDLHDGLCQQLTGISLMVRSLQSESIAQPARELTPIVDLLNGCIRETRTIIRGLHPVSEELGGLQIGLRELAQATEKSDHIPCELELELPPIRLAAEAASNMYRIAQESVRNAVKHSRCKRIRIALQNTDQRLLLSVQDDGIGFHETENTGGFGLAIMKYRARSIGGVLNIVSREGAGASVHLSIPLNA
jgi:signal transduction histidine kinase